MAPIGVAVVGLGHWGPNLLRVFASLPDVRVRRACDPDPARRAAVSAAYPGVEVTAGLAGVLEDPAVQAVAVATPASTHHPLALRCLEAGRHVLVEKPAALSRRQAEGLAAAAEEAGRVLMAGHVYLYHPAVLRARALIAGGVLGPLRHLRFVRVNPGPVRDDVSVVWDLLPHDLSVLWCWLGRLPERVHAVAGHPLGTPRADTAFAVLEYPGGLTAQLAASWLEPVKQRRIWAVGAEAALEVDDLELRLHRLPDLREPYYRDFGEFQMAGGRGTSERLEVERREPLKEECRAFLQRIRSGGAGAGPDLVAVTRCLEALQRSLDQRGERVEIP